MAVNRAAGGRMAVLRSCCCNPARDLSACRSTPHFVAADTCDVSRGPLRRSNIHPYPSKPVQGFSKTRGRTGAGEFVGTYTRLCMLNPRRLETQICASDDAMEGKRTLPSLWSTKISPGASRAGR